MTRRRLYIITTFAIILLMSVIGGGYAYWASSTNVPSDPEDVDFDINVGTGKVVNTFINITDENSDKGTLVPDGRIEEGTDQTTEISYIFVVHWNEENGGDYASGIAGSLITTLSGVTLEKDGQTYSDEHNLIEVVFEVDGIVVSSPLTSNIVLNDPTGVTVKVTVTMREPANPQEYNLIAGAAIKLSLSFKVNLI